MTARSSSAPRRRRSSPRARCAPEPDLAGSTTCSRSGAPRPPRTAFRGVEQLPPGGLLVWERGRIVEQRRWWSPPEYGAGGEPSGDLRDLHGRQRAAAPSCGRARRGIPVRWARLEPDQRARPDREAAASCAPSRLPSRTPLRRARPPGGGRPGARHPPPRRRGRRRREIARALPEVLRAHRDPAGADRAGAALPARRAGARERHHCGAHRRGRRRALLGVRPLQGGRGAGAAPSTTPSGRGRCSRSSIRYLGAGARGAAPPGAASCSRPGRRTTRSART